jgi:hypothetical protein
MKRSVIPASGDECWEIELLFLILKEGCRIEALQLENVERIETALALYLVVAWRINRLMRLGRLLPQLPADILFERDKWRAAYVLNRKKAPAEIPSLREVIRLIAQSGGFLARKGDVGNQAPRPYGWDYASSLFVSRLCGLSGINEMCVMGWLKRVFLYRCG